jgi:hypothetical protein
MSISIQAHNHCPTPCWFGTARLPGRLVAAAPDGTAICTIQLPDGRLSHFEFAPGNISYALMHKSIEEKWYLLRERDKMWRTHESHEDIVPVEAGVCIARPLDTQFPDDEARTDGKWNLLSLSMK